MTNETTKKCQEIMKSNLPDDLKFELIALLQNPATPTIITYPVIQERPVERTIPWWEHVTCGDSTGNAPGDWNPARKAWVDAQADNVMNSRVFYDGKTNIWPDGSITCSSVAYERR